MGKRLFYFSIIAGHNQEYFTYYYSQALTDIGNNYVFIMPESDVVVQYVHANPADNITISYFQDERGQKLDRKNILHKYRILKELIDVHRPDDFFLEYLMENVISVFLLSFRRVRFHGILYTILFRKEKVRFVDRMPYFFMRLSARLKSVFVLNDEKSSNLLNRKFLTNRFVYLPDPIQHRMYPENEEASYVDDSIVIVHLGALSRRKGTVELFRTIDMLKENGISDFKFVIGGRADKDIEKEYLSFREKYEGDDTVKVYEGFISYEMFHEIVFKAHFVILPYERVSQSSGLIGFAAMYRKPVLYTDYGLIGDIAGKYSLGYPLRDISAEGLYNFLTSNDMRQMYVNHQDYDKSAEYCRRNSITAFREVIFSRFSESQN